LIKKRHSYECLFSLIYALLNLVCDKPLTFNYEKVPITKKVKNNDTYPRYIKRLSCVLKYNVIHSKVTSKKTAVDTMNMNVPPKKLIYYSLSVKYI